MTVAYVRWKDAQHSLGDSEVSTLGGLSEMHYCGFLVKETEESVVVALEAENEGSVRLWMTIPRVNIIEMRTAELDKAFPKRRRK